VPEPTQVLRPAPAPAPPAARPAAGPHSRRWLINSIFVLAVLVGVCAALAVWINRQALNTNSWTNTSSQMLADPQIEAAIGSVLVNELFSSVDVAAELRSVLPTQVAGLASPATAGLRTLAIQLAPQVLSTATVQNAWRVANRTAQLELLQILNGGSKTVATTNGVVALQLHPLLVQLATQLGLQEQLAGAQSSLTSSTGQTARSAVQNRLGVTLPPLSGNIVILRSSQLKTAQNIAKAIKGLAVVLPAMALLLLLLALRMAAGWRRVALRTTGWCLIAIGLIVMLARRIIGNAVVNSLVKVPSDKPAAHQAFAIGTSLLYDAAIALVTYGAVIVLAAWLAGPTRPALAGRRAIAPSVREYPHYVYAAVGLVLLLIVVWGPFPSTRQPIPVLGIALVFALGIQALRQMTAREFPDAMLGDTTRSMRSWLAARRRSAFSAVSQARAGTADGGDPDTRISDLERLASLRDHGALTDEEFLAQKAIILNRRG
jgi:hypothetical protein